MKTPNIPLRSLFRVAFLVSAALGIIAALLIQFTISILLTSIEPKVYESVPDIEFFNLITQFTIISAILVSVLIFVFWTIYIFFIYYLSKISAYSHLKAILFSYITYLIVQFAYQPVYDVLLSPFFESVSISDMNTFGSLYNKLSYITDFPQFRILRIIRHLFLSLTIVLLIHFITNTLILKRKKYVVELENAQLRTKNIEATHLQLKHQVHPHFLFNSLNILKTLIKQQPDTAEIYLKKLSDFLRTSLDTNGGNGLLSLSKELKFSIDYLELQKLRFGDALEFYINVPERVKHSCIPSFSIQQLVENAIKHNVSTLKHPLIIHINYENDRIIVSNNIKEKDVSQESTGVGLANLTERYKILSGDDVIINSNDNFFSVSIKIIDNESCNNRG